MKFLEPPKKPKVIYTDNSSEFGKACEVLSQNHCTSTPHRSETHGSAERAVRRVKDGTSAVLLQSGLNEHWWAYSMECYTYLRNIQDLLSDGKAPTNGDSENLSKDQPFRLVHWLSVTLFPRKTSQESINLERKSYLECSLVVYCTRRASGKETFWSQTLRKRKRWTHQESMLGLNAKEVLTLKNGEKYVPARRWNSQTIWRRSSSENIHLNPRQPRPTRRTRKSSRRIRRVYTITSRPIAA